MAKCTTVRYGVTIKKRQYASRKRAAMAMRCVCRKRGWDHDNFRVYKCTEGRHFHFGRINGNGGEA